MGMFMTSVAFSCSDAVKWEEITSQIKTLVSNTDGLVWYFQHVDRIGCILSPYGKNASVLIGLSEKISALTGDYVVFANCVDSDFNMMSLWHNGENLEDSYIGQIYPEYLEFCQISKPDIALWTPLLTDKSKVEELNHALLSDQVFAEDNLIELSQLIGLPVFDRDILDDFS